MNERTQILVSVNDQVLKITDAPIVASGGVKEVDVVVTFCDKWRGMGKTAVFYRTPDDPYYAVLDENDRCTVAWEVCYEDGVFFFGMIGDDKDTRKTSTIARYKVKKGAISAEMKPSDPTPDVYAQIMALLGESNELSKSFRAEAATVIEETKQATAEARSATEEANGAADAAGIATENANAAAGNAQAEAASATQATQAANEAAGQARNAAASAEVSAQSASAEANNAKTATNLANAAAGDARDATQAANLAAGTATQAAGNANTAAGNAETGAANANKAAAAANTAAGSANQAAVAANDATVAADAARSETLAAKEAFLKQAEEALSVVHDTATADAPAIVCESAGEIIRVSDSSDRPLKGLTLCGKTTQDGTPTPENPAPLVSVGAGGAINTTVGGANIANLPNCTDGNSGVTWSCKDGIVSVKGTATGYSISTAYGIVASIPVVAGTYTVSGSKGDVGVYAAITKADGSVYYRTDKGTATFTLDGTETIVDLYCQFHDATVDEVLYPMLNFGSTALPWEPYKGQTITASTPNGLPGIPVASGGNYTDENGQQWVCDEIDFDRGVYVQRVLIQDFSGCTIDDTSYATVTSYQKYIGIRLLGSADNLAMCSHLDRTYYGFHDADRKHYYASNAGTLAVYLPKEVQVDTSALKIAVCLETPIETALSAEELAQYAALHANKPNTAAFNDSGAGMKLSYVADTKTYIDQKLAAISAAVLNN